MPFLLSNGVDSNSIFKIKNLPLYKSNVLDSNIIFTINEIQEEQFLKYNYLVSGKFKQQDFEIQISGDGYFREFYLNKELICMACGNKKPEKFVLFDQNVSSETLNTLFILGFNDYFR